MILGENLDNKLHANGTNFFRPRTGKNYFETSLTGNLK